MGMACPLIEVAVVEELQVLLELPNGANREERPPYMRALVGGVCLS